MARYSVYQQIKTFTVPREGFLERVVYNTNLDKKQLRVTLFLMSELDGWREEKTGNENDPNNFKKVDADQIANMLGYKKGDVKCILEELVDEGILQEGGSNTVKHGYRFTF